jgi:hypothetical protein
MTLESGRNPVSGRFQAGNENRRGMRGRFAALGVAKGRRLLDFFKWRWRINSRCAFFMPF